VSDIDIADFGVEINIFKETSALPRYLNSVFLEGFFDIFGRLVTDRQDLVFDTFHVIWRNMFMINLYIPSFCFYPASVSLGAALTSLL